MWAHAFSPGDRRGPGIGCTIAEQLAAHGWDVIAGVRSEADGAALTAVDPQRISAIILDVTDDGQIDALEEELPAQLDAVVNNAGIVMAGPMETLTSEQWRRAAGRERGLGQLAVTQAVLPRLRASHGGVLDLHLERERPAVHPLIGAYAASKFALEAAADALRMELKPADSVVLIEPAQTDTDMWRNRRNHGRRCRGRADTRRAWPLRRGM